MTLFTGKSYHHNTGTVKNALEKANEDGSVIRKLAKYLYKFSNQYSQEQKQPTTKIGRVGQRYIR